MRKESAVEGFFPSLLSLFISPPPLCIYLFIYLFSILKIFLFSFSFLWFSRQGTWAIKKQMNGSCFGICFFFFSSIT